MGIREVVVWGVGGCCVESREVVVWGVGRLLCGE